MVMRMMMMMNGRIFPSHCLDSIAIVAAVHHFAAAALSLVLLFLVLHYWFGLVTIPRGLAQCVTDLVLGLVVTNVGPPPGFWILADQTYPRGRVPANHFQYFHNDDSFLVFGSGCHVSGYVLSHQVSQHSVGLVVIILASPANDYIESGRLKVFRKCQPTLAVVVVVIVVAVLFRGRRRLPLGNTSTSASNCLGVAVSLSIRSNCCVYCSRVIVGAVVVNCWSCFCCFPVAVDDAAVVYY